ncbi:hypothetical protein IFM89_016501 [Coptis chinensis]|uniref:Uncharacterized protein n=1 Tax=Coptis chinensis TaxID=261450 RepID=A0A835I885_9MAGN|nr:hypothetical protein IFM89_016501 [Coptis chinensis]
MLYNVYSVLVKTCTTSRGPVSSLFCAFRDSYSQLINHVPDIDKPKGKPEGSFILPPDTKPTPGRRRNKRKESMGARERKLQENSQQVRVCDRCLAEVTQKPSNAKESATKPALFV